MPRKSERVNRGTSKQPTVKQQKQRKPRKGKENNSTVLPVTPATPYRNGNGHVAVAGDHQDIGIYSFTADDVLPPEWFYKPWVPRHTYTLLAGRSSAGKSTFGAFLASKAERPLILPGEEDIKRVALPRLLKAGVDPTNVKWMPAGEHWLFPRDRQKLVNHIKRENRDFVFVDPIDPYLEEADRENENAAMRRVLECFRQVAEECGIAIVLIRHPSRDKDSIIGGSRAFDNHPRAILKLALLPGSWTQGIIEPHKPPLGRRTPPTYYELVGEEEEPKQFVFGQLVPTARAREAGEVDDRMEREKIDQTEKLLLALLGDGEPMESKEVYKYARQEEIKDRTLRYAATRLGVVMIREGIRHDHRCYWSLPSLINGE